MLHFHEISVPDPDLLLLSLLEPEPSPSCLGNQEHLQQFNTWESWRLSVPSQSQRQPKCNYSEVLCTQEERKDTSSQKIFPVHSYAVGVSPPNLNACASLKFYYVLGKRNLEKPRKQMISESAHSEKYHFVSNKELIFLGKHCFLNLVSLSSSLNYPPISVFHQQTTPKPTVISLNRNSINIATYS